MSITIIICQEIFGTISYHDENCLRSLIRGDSPACPSPSASRALNSLYIDYLRTITVLRILCAGQLFAAFR